MRVLGVILLTCLPLSALRIVVDYRFDESGFFDSNPEAKVAVEAAAARWGRIVNQSLLPVNMTDGETIDGRFALIHPARGGLFICSAAASAATDFGVVQRAQDPADLYLNGFQLGQDEWVLFAGARNLEAVASGGAIGDGGNLPEVLEDPNQFLGRGFQNAVQEFSVLGGFVSFDLDREWNFDLSAQETPGKVDLYSVALHEIGHGLGLNSRSINEFRELIQGDRFVGAQALAAFEADNGFAIPGLLIENVPGEDFHWEIEAHQSKIFPLGDPLYWGTQGPDQFQQLLMEFGFRPLSRGGRLEITNVDIGALRDLGWSVVEEPPPPSPELPVSVSGPAPGANGVVISLMTEAGATYTIQTSPDGLSWVDVSPSIVGDGGMLTWEDGQAGFQYPFPAAGLKSKFYRVVKQP